MQKQRIKHTKLTSYFLEASSIQCSNDDATNSRQITQSTLHFGGDVHTPKVLWPSNNLVNWF